MKVEKVIASFNPIERNRLRKFIESPYFNPNSDITTLFDLIEFNVRNSVELSAEEYWKKTMLGKKFNSGLFRKNCSNILNLINQFLSVEAIVNDELSMLEQLEIQKHSLNRDELNSVSKPKYLSDFNEGYVLKTIDYVRLYTINKLRFEYSSDFKKRSRIEKSTNSFLDLQELDDSLVLFHSIEKLKLALLSNNLSKITAEALPPIIVSETLEQLQALVIRHPGNLLLQTFWKLYNLLVLSNQEFNYTEIIDILEQDKLSNSESRLIYEYLQNFFVREGNKIKDGYEQEHKIYEIGLKNGYLFNNGIIDPIDYSNIIFTACRISNYSWALNFAEDYKDRLSAEHRKTAYSFNKARIHWYNNDFEKVIETLRNVDYEDLTYNLNSKLMILTSFFELDEYDLVDSTIKSFKVFLRRRRNIPAIRKKAFYGFCEVLGHILKAEERMDSKRLVAAKTLIEHNRSIPNVEWLRQKITELENIIK